MRRLPIDNGWYCDALPSGAYVAALFEQHKVLTSDALVETGIDLLFVRASDAKGPLRFAGQANVEPNDTRTGNWESVNSAPPSRVGGSFGVNPVIYDLNGDLKQARESHQGYRFVRPDNSIATGDETFFDPVNTLYEWSDAGDIRVGQDSEDGAIVLIDGQRRKLEPGHCTFIRATASNGVYAFGIVKLKENKSVLIWASRADLLALPLAPVEPPTEPPIEPPEPEPEPPVPPDPDFPPAQPGDSPMEPFSAALRLGAHFFARVSSENAPWPGWKLIKFDRTDPNDPACKWDITQPVTGNAKLRAKHAQTGLTLTMDFTEFGGNVCQGFYASPESAGWFGYQQLAGWQLGPGGVEVVTVDYSHVGTPAAAPCLTVVRL